MIEGLSNRDIDTSLYSTKTGPLAVVVNDPTAFYIGFPTSHSNMMLSFHDEGYSRFTNQVD